MYIMSKKQSKMKEKTEKKEYKGVYYDKRRRHYRSSITVFGEVYHCGTSDTPKGAAMLRDRRILAMQLPYKLLQVLKPKKEVV